MKCVTVPRILVGQRHAETNAQEKYGDIFFSENRTVLSVFWQFMSVLIRVREYRASSLGWKVNEFPTFYVGFEIGSSMFSVNRAMLVRHNLSPCLQHGFIMSMENVILKCSYVL